MTTRKRTCIVGLDGVPIDLLADLATRGVMPRVAERIAAANLRPMRASLPEISSVSWSSFMTGTQAGEHGIFGFTDLDPSTYELRFPSFRDLAHDTLWDRLGEHGVRSVVINQPATYPARPIPGAIVSGFVAIDLSRSVQPLRWLGPLRRLDYRIDIDTVRSRRDHDWLFRDLYATLRARRKALDAFWDHCEWDLFQLVVTGTDRLYHYLWDAVVDEQHPRHQQTLDYHHEVDALVGDIFDRFAASEPDAEARFWMLSDHGFCAIEQEVQLNAWLASEGFLEIEGPGPDLTGMTDSSRAFALDPGRIVVHRRDRFARGQVDESEVASLTAAIANGLRQLRYDGKPVIREVFASADIYSGPRAASGPDLVALAHPGFDLKASPTAPNIFSRTDLVGMHTYDDAFLLAPYPIEGDLWIGQVAEHLEAQFSRSSASDS